MAFDDYYGLFAPNAQPPFGRPGPQQQQPQPQQPVGQSNLLTALLGQQQGQNGASALGPLGSFGNGQQGGPASFAGQYGGNQQPQPTGYEALGNTIGQGLGMLMRPLGRNGTSNTLADSVGYEPFGGGGWGGG